MKSEMKYLKAESLLVIIPTILFLVARAFGKNTPLDFHLHDTYFIVDSTTAFIPVFVFMIIIYSLHIILRATGKWGGAFCKVHIYASVFLYLLIEVLSRWISYSGLAGAPRRYYDVSVLDSFYFYSRTEITIVIILLLFLLLQFIFFVYVIIRLLKKAQ